MHFQTISRKHMLSQARAVNFRNQKIRWRSEVSRNVVQNPHDDIATILVFSAISFLRVVLAGERDAEITQVDPLSSWGLRKLCWHLEVILISLARFSRFQHCSLIFPGGFLPFLCARQSCSNLQQTKQRAHIFHRPTVLNWILASPLAARRRKFVAVFPHFARARWRLKTETDFSWRRSIEHVGSDILASGFISGCYWSDTRKTFQRKKKLLWILKIAKRGSRKKVNLN